MTRIADEMLKVVKVQADKLSDALDAALVRIARIEEGEIWLVFHDYSALVIGEDVRVAEVFPNKFQELLILAHNEAFLELAPRVALSRLSAAAEHYVTSTPTVQ